MAYFTQQYDRLQPSEAEGRPWLNGVTQGLDAFTASGSPICTGTSVIAVTFDGGIALAADTLASYGKMARYRNVSRLFDVNNTTLVGVSGDIADYQWLRTIIEEKQTQMRCVDPRGDLSPVALHAWLTSVLYHRRSKFDPLWNSYVVGGLVDGKPYLGAVDKLGVRYENPFIATGIGCFFIRQRLENMYLRALGGRDTLKSKEEAVEILRESIETLYHVDCCAHNQFEIGVVTAEGCKILPKQTVTGRNWKAMAEYVNGYE